MQLSEFLVRAQLESPAIAIFSNVHACRVEEGNEVELVRPQSSGAQVSISLTLDLLRSQSRSLVISIDRSLPLSWFVSHSIFVVIFGFDSGFD